MRWACTDGGKYNPTAFACGAVKHVEHSRQGHTTLALKWVGEGKAMGIQPCRIVSEGGRKDAVDVFNE